MLIGAVPPLMLKTAANPGGLPIEVFDGIRAGVLADRSQFFKDLTTPFYGANRPGAKVSQGVRDSFWLQGMLAGYKSALDCIKAFSETDFTEDLKKFDVPTLIMHGDDDQIVPIGASAMLSSKLVKGVDAEGLSGPVARHVHDQQGSDQRRSAGVHQGIDLDARSTRRCNDAGTIGDANEETSRRKRTASRFSSGRGARPDRPAASSPSVHGVNSHSGYYTWAAEQLVAGGLAVYALDLHGRGKSDGERFYLETIADYVGDVDTLVTLAKSREPGLPVFLLGHSAGGVISCVYTLEHQAELAGLICESFAFQVAAPDFALAVVKGLSHLAPHAHVLRLKNEEFSRDPKVVQAMNDDPLIAHEVQPTKTVAELVRADERLKQGVSADHAAGAHPPRHRRQGHEAERQPALLRHGRFHGQDAEALRGPRPRPAQRRRQGSGHGGHQGLDRCSSTREVTAIRQGVREVLMSGASTATGVKNVVSGPRRLRGRIGLGGRLQGPEEGRLCGHDRPESDHLAGR